MSAAEGTSAIINLENILVDLADESRDSVVEALLDNLVATKRIAKKHVAAAKELVAKREAEGSTALGYGLAVPHARVTFPAPVMAFALIRNGNARDYRSLDRETVRFVFLLLTPAADPDEEVEEGEQCEADRCHMALFRSIMKFFQVPVHCRALSGCRTPAEIWSVFEDYGFLPK